MGDENVSGGTLCEVCLKRPPNKASGLLAIENDALPEAHGWGCAFWTVLGEGPEGARFEWATVGI